MKNKYDIQTKKVILFIIQNIIGSNIFQILYLHRFH